MDSVEDQIQDLLLIETWQNQNSIAATTKTKKPGMLTRFIRARYALCRPCYYKLTNVPASQGRGSWGLPKDETHLRPRVVLSFVSRLAASFPSFADNLIGTVY
jgi:hypothetical protein